MANRRMFSKRIVNSARFLKMPVSTQNLYFHLGLHADDDGVVEAYPIIQTVGATEDDLKVLVAKSFVQVLNEDLVSYITDWNENNKIRADRKIDSIYKDLLLQVVPTAQLTQKRPRADQKLTKTGNGQPMDNQMSTNGQPMDGIGKDRIGQDSIGKDRTGQVRLEENCNHSKKEVKERAEIFEEYFDRKANSYEKRLLNQISCDDEELFEKAFDIAVRKNSLNMGYVIGIFNNWQKEGIRTMDDYIDRDIELNGI